MGSPFSYSTQYPRFGQPQQSQLAKQYQDALGAEGGTSAATQKDFLQRADNFDPMAALETYSKGAYDKIFSGVGGVGDQLKAEQGKAVGAGRLNTGFYDQDRGTVVERGLGELDSAIAQGALTASSQDLSRIGLVGDYANQSRSRYLDLLSGGLDREQAKANADQAQSANLFGDVTSLAGAVLPFVL